MKNCNYEESLKIPKSNYKKTILHYINDPNFTLHQWSQFYITSMIPILHYINDSNFTLHQWSQFYITSMIPILHYIIDPNLTLHQWTQLYITSMLIVWWLNLHLLWLVPCNLQWLLWISPASKTDHQDITAREVKHNGKRSVHFDRM
jgi:hypothetical protein